MKAPVNLALFPAGARRRARWMLAASTLLVGSLTVLHVAWAYSGPDPVFLRTEADRLMNEQTVWQQRLLQVIEDLDPPQVRGLGTQVDAANAIIVELGVDPVGLLQLLETNIPAGVVVRQLTLTPSSSGLRADVTLVAPAQAPIMQLVRELNRSPTILELSPIREEATPRGTELVVSLVYRPEGRPQ